MSNYNIRRTKFYGNVPPVVCLCGSTRFKEAFQEAIFNFTLEGVIVLSVGSVTTSDEEHGITPDQKVRLDELHKRKIDLADFVYVLDVDGYVGPSTRSEIEYATEHGKVIFYLTGERPFTWNTWAGGEDR